MSALADEGDGADGSGDSGGTSTVNVSVPWVVNKTVADAKVALTAAGLGFSVEGDTSSSATVVNQNPSGGTMVAAGTVITITGEAAESPTVTDLYVGYVDPDTDEYIQYPDASAGQTPIVTTKGGTLELLASVWWSTGSGGYASDQGVSVTWSSSDTSVATVSPSGVVTAQGDGTVTITCTTSGYGNASGSIDVRIAGQDGPYVKEVAVTDADGNPYGDNRIVFTEFDGSTAVDLYAMVLYSDGTIKKTANGDEIENLTWSVTNTDTAYINSETGRLKPLQDGSIQATATVTGGLDGEVSGSVYVVVDTGQYTDRVPSDTLTVHICYSSDIDTDYRTETYTVDSFSALGLTYQAYTQVKANGGYQTLTAQGVYVTTLLDALGINADEISTFYFMAFDFGNKQQVSAYYVLERVGYYFPYFGDGILSGAQVAPAMIAISTATSVDDVDYSSMTSLDCFRLCLGSSGKDDAAAQKSYYCVSDMWIVLEGSPPVSDGDGEDPSGGGEGEGDGSGGDDGEGDGNGDAEGDGNADTDTEGDGSGSATEGDGSGSGTEGDGSGAAADDDDDDNVEDNDGSGAGESGGGTAEGDEEGNTNAETKEGLSDSDEVQQTSSGEAGEEGESGEADGAEEVEEAEEAESVQEAGGSEDESVEESEESGGGADESTADADGAGISEEAEEAGETDDGEDGTGSRWQVWQMMSNATSDVGSIESDNLDMLVVPFALLALFAGGLTTRIRFRRELPA